MATFIYLLSVLLAIVWCFCFFMMDEPGMTYLLLVAAFAGNLWCLVIQNNFLKKYSLDYLK